MLLRNEIKAKVRREYLWIGIIMRTGRTQIASKTASTG
jgi:hypothetical protein